MSIRVEDKRKHIFNFRLSDTEKVLLEERFKQSGSRSVTDFVRTLVAKSIEGPGVLERLDLLERRVARLEARKG